MIERPCGLWLTLQKGSPAPTETRSNCVLGYYDHLQIVPVPEWSGFFPGAIEIAEPPLTRSFPIKVLFPPDEQDTLINENASWWLKRLPNHLDDMQSFSTEFPCVSLVLLNTSDAFRRVCQLNSANSVKEQLKKLYGILEQHEDTVRSSHMLIMPSIGYSDFCMLLAEEQWQNVFELLEILRGETKGIGQVLSTDYVIPIFCPPRPLPDGWFEVFARNMSCDLRVRLSLKPGCQPDVLCDVFNLKEMELKRISGASDYEWTPIGPTEKAQCLEYLSGQRCTEAVNSCIGACETTLLQPVTEVVTGDRERPSTDANILQRAVANLRGLLERYFRQTAGHRQPVRVIHAVSRQLVALDEIGRSAHNAALQKSLAGWLDAVACAAETCLEAASGSEANRDPAWGAFRSVVESIANPVGGFLADLTRTDSFFMERERYNHPSVASATSLILAYTSWQNEFAQLLNKFHPADHVSYKFLVVSGGQDLTSVLDPCQTLEPFWLDKEATPVCLPLIIEMAQYGLYDCGGTVFRMAHECLHYCGNRHRLERRQAIFTTVSAALSKQLARVGFLAPPYNEAAIEAAGRNLHAPGLLGDVQRIWAENKSEFVAHMTERLGSLLESSWTEDQGGTERSLSSRNLTNWLYSTLLSILSPIEVTGSPEQTAKGARGYFGTRGVSEFIREALLKQAAIEKQFRDQCQHIVDRLARQASIDSREYSFRPADIKIAKAQQSGAAVSVREWTRVLTIIERIQRSIIGNGNSQKLKALIDEVVRDLYQECYADVMACHILRPSFVEYIMSFLYESADPLKQLRDQRWNLRICIAGYLHFGSSCLTTEGIQADVLQELTTAVSKLVRDRRRSSGDEQGDAAYAEQIVEAVNSCFSQSILSEPEIAPLVSYLELCKTALKENDLRELLPFRESFQHLSLWRSHTADAFDIYETLVALYSSPPSCWYKESATQKKGV